MHYMCYFNLHYIIIQSFKDNLNLYSTENVNFINNKS